MDEAVVLNLALRMRRAIEALPRKDLPPPMSEFPRGSCGDASLLLGAFLADAGCPGFEYVSATRGSVGDGSWTTHAWLARGDLIVDVTADQFPDAPGGVIVERCSAWHREFAVEQRGPGDFREWSAMGGDYLRGVYSRLRRMLFGAPAVD